MCWLIVVFMLLSVCVGVCVFLFCVYIGGMFGLFKDDVFDEFFVFRVCVVEFECDFVMECMVKFMFES